MNKALESDIVSEELVSEIPRIYHKDSMWKVRFNKWHSQLIENPSMIVKIKMSSHRISVAAQRLRQFQKENGDYSDIRVKQRGEFTYFYLTKADEKEGE